MSADPVRCTDHPNDPPIDAQTVLAAFLANADLPATGDTWEEQCEEVATEILTDLYVSGWRIVRPERAGYVRTDLHPDESRRLYIGSSPMEGDEWLYRIAEEWTPDA